MVGAGCAVTASSDARAHLRKAQEFLLAAQVGLNGGLYDAATSAAVIAGINAKDALCLALTGRTGKSENHQQALAELGAAGAAARPLVSPLSRLLALKSRAQYQSAPITPESAAKAVDWAEKIVTAVREQVSG